MVGCKLDCRGYQMQKTKRVQFLSWNLRKLMTELTRGSWIRLSCKEFGVRWRWWIQGYLSSIVIVVWLRQVDLLSHFLFTLVVDDLSRTLHRAFERVVQGLIIRSEDLEASHLSLQMTLSYLTLAIQALACGLVPTRI